MADQFDFDALSRYQMGHKSAATPLGVSEIIKGVEGFGSNIGGAMGMLGAGLQGNAQAATAQRERDDQLALHREATAGKEKRFNMLFDSLFKPIGMRNNQTNQEQSISPILLALTGQMPFDMSPWQTGQGQQPQPQQGMGWQQRFSTSLPAPIGGIPQITL